MRYGLILSAGKQTRFKSDVPKALSNINGTCLLDMNISNMKKFCDDVRVVCSHDNNSYFTKYNRITIKSGYGCGDAVYKALRFLNPGPMDEVFIQWGDCVIKPEIFKECLAYYNEKIIVPCVIEKEPYVQIIPDRNRLKVLFSKFGEKTSEGFHDLSLFYGNAKYILEYLGEFCNKFKTWNYTYNHRHGNEFNFLDIFNDTNIEGNVLEIKDYTDVSFNTIEEMEKVKI